MHALLSLCNERRPSSQGVLLFDFEGKTGRWIRVGADAEIMGTRGICLYGGVAFVLYTVGWWETRLSTYDLRDGLKFVDDVMLREVKDPHSLCVHDDRLLVASTGTDEILAYDLRDGAPGETGETFWRAAAGGEDTHHVNAVASDGRRVLISAFGLRAGEFWTSAENGYIRDVGSDEVVAEALLHPHSVRTACGRLYFTESSRQVLRVGTDRTIAIGGYVRGCDIAGDDCLLVGSNAARRTSRSRGVVANSNNIETAEGDLVGKCAVARVTLGTHVTREYFDITPFGKEIYDICVLP